MTQSAPIARRSARIVLLDQADRLLFRVEGVFVDGEMLWITPGGVEPGESYEQAAERELWEETGIVAAPGPCVWTRRHLWRYERDGRWQDARKRFYLARVAEATLSNANWTEEEHAVLTAHHWWSAAEIAAADAVFVPRRLPELLPPLLAGEYPETPADAGN